MNTEYDITRLVLNMSRLQNPSFRQSKRRHIHLDNPKENTQISTFGVFYDKYGDKC